MDFITVHPDNLDDEDICCANSHKKGDECAVSKKEWMKNRFAEGLVFKKLNQRGKVFIEYIPAENAWCPITAQGYMFIDCFWVSGNFKGKGYGAALLEECIKAAKESGMKGVVALSSDRKVPFLSDPKFFKYKGFTKADSCEPYYELLYLPFDSTGKAPRFKDCVKHRELGQKGFVLYYTNHCPYTSKYVPLIESIAAQRGTEFLAIRLETKEQAQNAPAPFTTYSLFYNGEFLTNEILSEKKFIEILESKTEK